jgi:hypothetical protein
MSQPARYKLEMTWGEALGHYVSKQAGGLKRVHLRIISAVGPMYGTRNTFAKLFDLEGPPENAKDRQRAWLLVAAIGREPKEWGLSEADRPPLLVDLGSLNHAIPGSLNSGIRVAQRAAA